MNPNGNAADPASEDQAHDAVFAEAKTLSKGDCNGAQAVLANAIMTEISPLAIGALFNAIKASTGIGVGDIRKQFERMAGARRRGADDGPSQLPFAVYEPAAHPSPLADVLDEIADMFRARVSCSEDDISIATLWGASTWGVREGLLPGQEANAAPGPSRFPRLRVGSGGPDSGKTTLLESLSYVAARAVTADSISASSLFRLVHAHQPTLFLDETDAWANGNENIRMVINSGHRRTGTVIINTKDAGDENSDWEPTTFRTFAPIAIAGLGSLAATIEDRSIKIVMVKRVSFMGRYFSDTDMVAFRNRIAPHLAAHGDAMANAMAKGTSRKNMLSLGLANRAADNWQPLIVVAKLAGQVWFKRGLNACRGLGANPKNARTQTKPEHLLADLYAYRRALVQSRWTCRQLKRKANGREPLTTRLPGEDAPRDMLSTSGFIEWLASTPGYASPWAEGARRDALGRLVEGPSPHAVAKVMKSFQVRPTRRDIWSAASQRNEPVRGYLVADLRPLWAAYGSRNSQG
jgi:hypothetical protein